jgi:hypothetical protein
MKKISKEMKRALKDTLWFIGATFVVCSVGTLMYLAWHMTVFQGRPAYLLTLIPAIFLVIYIMD